jgi:hypothetical protein
MMNVEHKMFRFAWWCVIMAWITLCVPACKPKSVKSQGAESKTDDAGLQYSNEARADSQPSTRPGGITKDDARRIANTYFGDHPEAGCYVEKRGRFFFVAPPIKHKPSLEAAGIYIDESSGKIYRTRPLKGTKNGSAATQDEQGRE